jgi:hypothetical protein
MAQARAAAAARGRECAAGAAAKCCLCRGVSRLLWTCAMFVILLWQCTVTLLAERWLQRVDIGVS